MVRAECNGRIHKHLGLGVVYGKETRDRHLGLGLG